MHFMQHNSSVHTNTKNSRNIHFKYISGFLKFHLGRVWSGFYFLRVLGSWVFEIEFGSGSVRSGYRKMVDSHISNPNRIILSVYQLILLSITMQHRF